jgi:hypothetical protein
MGYEIGKVVWMSNSHWTSFTGYPVCGQVRVVGKNNEVITLTPIYCLGQKVLSEGELLDSETRKHGRLHFSLDVYFRTGSIGKNCEGGQEYHRKFARSRVFSWEEYMGLMEGMNAYIEAICADFFDDVNSADQISVSDLREAIKHEAEDLVSWLTHGQLERLLYFDIGMESVEGDFEEEEFYDVALQFIEEQFEEYIENEDAYMERYFQSLIPDEPDYDRYYDD